jgi:hypothetical protein
VARKRNPSPGNPVPANCSGRSPEGPPERRLYSVGEVLKRSGISRQVLHNYTVIGLITPAERTPKGRRYYGESAFRRIELIRRMLKSGYTLQALRELFPWGT